MIYVNWNQATRLLHLGGQAPADGGRVGEGGARRERHARLPLGRPGPGLHAGELTMTPFSGYCVGDTSAVGSYPSRGQPLRRAGHGWQRVGVGQ